MRIWRLLFILPLFFKIPVACGQGVAVPATPVALSASGAILPGAGVALCNPMATTAASVTNGIATLTMVSNPITAGYAANQSITVAGFTGSDAANFNGTFSMVAVTSTTILYADPVGNTTATSNGTVIQPGSSTQSCAALVPVYTDWTLGTPSTANPTTADGLGNYQFYVPPGNYWVQVYGPTVGQGTSTLYPVTAGAGPGAGSGNISGTTANHQLTYGTSTSKTIAPATGIQTPDGNSLAILGPDPWYDVTADGSYFASTALATVTCTNGLNTVTLSGSVGDFAKGNLVLLPGCGASTTSSAPSSATGTPEGNTGTTHYSYYIESCTYFQSCTPYTTVAITTGVASLSDFTYNQISSAHDSTINYHLIYGPASTAATATLLAYYDADIYDDTGYQYHGELLGGFAPTHPSATASLGILEATITNISGTTITLSVPASNSTSSTMTHDCNPEVNAAQTEFSEAGGTIYFPASKTASEYLCMGLIPHTQDHLRIKVEGAMTMDTQGNVPFLQTTTARTGLTMEGGNWPVSPHTVSTSGIMDTPVTYRDMVLSNIGKFYVNGQIYDPFYVNMSTTASGYFLELDQASFASIPTVSHLWSQGTTCGNISVSSGQVHGMHILDSTFEGANSPTCPGEGLILSLHRNPSAALVQGFEMDNSGTDSETPSSPVPVILLSYGSLTDPVFNSVQLATSLGDIIKQVNLGGGTTGNTLMTGAVFNASNLQTSSGSVISGGSLGCNTVFNGTQLTGTWTYTHIAGCIGPVINGGTINSHNIQKQALPGVFTDYGTCDALHLGAEGWITDSTTNTYGATVTGGGSSYPLVHMICTGASGNWIVD